MMRILRKRALEIQEGTYTPSLKDSLFYSVYTLIVCVGGISASVYFIHDPQNIELLIIPLGFLGANILEYIVHRWPMHHEYKGMEPLTILHMYHHDYFGGNAYRLKHVRNLEMIVFPPIVLNIVAFGPTLIGSLLLWWFWSLNAALIWCATILGYYLSMQLVHVICHLDVHNPLLRILPGMRYLWNHHKIHHTRKYMLHKNFNFIVPVTDILMGTSTQDRHLASEGSEHSR